MNPSFLKAYDWYVDWVQQFKDLPPRERNEKEDQLFAELVGWCGTLEFHGTADEPDYEDTFIWFMYELFIALDEFQEGCEVGECFIEEFDDFIEDGRHRLNLNKMPWEIQEILT